MGSVAQAVVEFDEAVLAPWRPPLVHADGRRPRLRAVPEVTPQRPMTHVGAVDGRPAPGHHAPRRPSAQPRRPLPAGPALHGSLAGTAGAAARPGTGRPPAPGLRLTRRARRLGLVAGLTVGVVIGSWVGSTLSGDGGSGLRLAGETSVVVGHGDTLWSIAAGIAGDEEDVRAVVSDIRALNGLSDASLVPGQVLVLP